MELVQQDWVKLKTEDPNSWKKDLWDATLKVLRSIPDLQIATLNEVGIYHRFKGSDHYETTKEQYVTMGTAQEDWISRGIYPGIWTALFDKCNTYSIARSRQFLRFYFRDGFDLYDPENPEHTRLWDEWTGKETDNAWKDMRGVRGVSLEERMRFMRLPGHKRFYVDHSFGAFLGLQDYASLVIIDELAIEGVEFIDNS